ncbi:ABC transporter permease [Canibacter sp. lx-45]|uniref:ABC transporter permease n=1 Tax=Canibacter zhuwentaonis TaxID=2837491 RepID=UPI001BDBCF5F|nr:ABC transporter permease [Canibacter zhuwentaonis]MBT1035677.1 ABC transporter permease [Canibacter zhuwentaonis]
MTQLRAPHKQSQNGFSAGRFASKMGNTQMRKKIPALWVLRTLLSSLGQIIFTVFIAVTASFFALALVPGDPVSVRLGSLARISEAQKEALCEQLGLTDPLPQQYLRHLGSFLTGDLGYSYHQKLPVAEIIGRQLMPTVQLAVVAMLFALVLVLLGQVISRAGTQWGVVSYWRERVLMTLHTLGVSAPSYWVGYLLLMLFAFKLGWFPTGGAKNFSAVILPATALALPIAGLLGQVVDAELQASERTAFALSSRARGMSRAGYAVRHGVKHAVPAVSTLVTNIVGSLFGGAVLTETVFARPGIGRVALDAVVQRDMPTVLGLVALAAVLFATLGQLLKLLLLATDPRLRANNA